MSEIQLLIAGYTKLDAGPDANFGLDLISRFRTTREVYRTDEKFLVMLDATDFGHWVGEVELLSGENATAPTASEWPSSVRRTAPVAESQSPTVSSKDADAIHLHIDDGLSRRRRGSLRIWMENAPHLHGWGGPPNSCEEAWRKCAHMGEDFREGRIWTATEISGECSQCTADLQTLRS